MKILLSGGGTAGHINPAIAIAQILEASYPRAEIVFVGTPKGMEASLIKKAGYRMRELAVEGLRRKLTPQNVKIVFKALGASRRAKEILRDEMPDLVIGTGGYVCFPILWAAQRIGIKTALHESNAYPGITVRLLAPRADAVLLSFASCRERLSRNAKCSIVGNPVRRDFAKFNPETSRKALAISDDEFLLLSFGGSLGARTINHAIGNCMQKLLNEHPNLRIVHATGMQNYDDFCRFFGSYFKADKRIVVVPYLDGMACYMTAADLLLSRSGAMTLSEAAYAETPAILVPYPHATDDHQTKNAAMLAKQGAAILIPDSELAPERLHSEISKLIANKERLSEMRKSIGTLAIRDADAHILRELRKLLD